MAKAFGDESGLLWNKQVYIGRTASKDTFRGGKLPDPADYRPPDYRSILNCPRIAIDIETFDPKLETSGPGVYRQDGFILGVAIDYGDGDRRYYPLRHATGTNLNEPEFISSLRAEARNYTGVVVNANIQYDLDWLGSLGVVFGRAKFFDVQFAEPLLDENQLSYSLESISQRRLGMGKFTSTLEDNYGPDFIKYLKDIHPYYVGEYACGDVYLPLEIMDRQMKDLRDEGLLTLCDVEHRLLPLLLQMRSTGVRVDTKAAEEAREGCYGEAKELLLKMKHITGLDVEVDAANSIARAFDQLSITYPRTPKGAPSFRRAWLENHPSELARMITAVRKLRKTAGTFLNNYILDGHVGGRVHCMFHPLRSEEGGTVSGRFSSSNPNLQNIPARDKKLGPMCRAVFIPENGQLWGRIDWSQIEYRFLVHYAVAAKCQGAEIAAEMFRNDKSTDFHTMASDITGKDREVAKSINFGVCYGMGKDTMAANLGTTVEEAEPVLAEFHKRLPWLKKIYNKASDRANENGYIRTILGRKRRFDRWERGGFGEERKFLSDAAYQALEQKDRRGFRRAGTHKALNALLQGSAADLMKKAMVEAYEDGLFKVLSPHLTVHDELNVSIPQTKEGQEAFKDLINVMETTLKLEVPVLAEAKTGANWSKCK